MIDDVLQKRWETLLTALGRDVESTREVLHDLMVAYGAEGRWYHNLDHLNAVLSTIEELANEAVHPSLVMVAAWFHDAVYDTHAKDNEERSALLAETTCQNWSLAEEDVALVGHLIRATKTHEANDRDHDTHVLLDADLAILGTEETRYDQYAAAIRKEYAWVKEDDYQRGRVEVLEKFLKRERLFRLERMRDRYETRARRNLFREIASLQKYAT